MSLRYIDSFDHYDTNAIVSKWNHMTTTIGRTVTIEAGAGRNSTQCMRFSGTSANSATVMKSFDAQAAWCVGFALKIPAAPIGLTPIIQFNLIDTVQCALCVDTSNHLAICRGTITTVTGGTSSNTLTPGTWYYVEIVVKPVDSVAADSCYVNVDGVTWATVAAGQDLKAHLTLGGADSIVFQGIKASANTDIDDLYVCDDQAGATGPFGNSMIQVLHPDTDSFEGYSDWTASTGTWYTCLDEAIANGDTDYVYCATSGAPATPDIVQMVEMSNLTYTPAAITGLQWNMYARKSDAGYRFIRRFARSHTGGATSVGAVDHSLGIDYQFYTEVFEGDPCNASTAWSRTLVDNFEAGMVLHAFG